MSDINDYYRQKIQNARKEILSKGDHYILKVEPEELVDYYYNKDALPLIEKDESRKINIEQESRLRKTPSGFPVGRSLILTIKYPIISRDKITEVLKRKSQTYFPNRYQLDYDNGFIISKISIPIEGTGQEKRVEGDIRQIEHIIKQKNDNVFSQNKSYKLNLKQFIEQQKNRVKKDTELIDGLLKKIPYSIKRKDEIKVEPLDIKVRKTIEPIYPIVEKPSEPYLERHKVDSVIEIIKNAGKGFEVTPHVYTSLNEEDLRDIILGFLNAIFALGATGESFVKKGKTDIHIIINDGSLLTAECKKWDGQKLYSDTIDQLFDYLIWRQNYGILITFSDRAKFSEIVAKAKEKSLEHPTILKKKIDTIETSHFITEHRFPEDSAKTVIIHHLLFNLYHE